MPVPVWRSTHQPIPYASLDEGFGYYLVLEENDSTWRAIAEPLHIAIKTAVLAARD